MMEILEYDNNFAKIETHSQYFWGVLDAWIIKKGPQRKKNSHRPRITHLPNLIASVGMMGNECIDGT
jgi:hypothetical protein